jgi:hypothetical protein
MPRVGIGHAEGLGDEFAHAVIDLSEEIARGRIQRVVEIEDPAIDMRKTAYVCGPVEGLGKRCAVSCRH